MTDRDPLWDEHPEGYKYVGALEELDPDNWVWVEASGEMKYDCSPDGY